MTIGTMRRPENVIAFFAERQGLDERPPRSNCNPITRDFYEYANRPSALAPGCYAWCAAAVSLAINAAWGDVTKWPDSLGVKPTYRSGFAYVPSMRWAFGAAGLFYRHSPRRGDIVIFDWDGDDEGDHTGIFVEDLGDGTCLTWEGNTNADLIEQLHRPYQLISGFCRVNYDGADPWSALFVPILAI